MQIPLGTFTVVTGPSGSGKSSLVEDVLFASLARTLHRAKTFPGAHDAIRGVELVNKVIRVDQQAIGQTPTSNPATFTGVFDLIRTLYAQLPEAKLRGYTPRRFSFNVPGGRCEKCEGNGQLRIEMHFLPDVWVECDTCHGQRYNPETLAVRYHDRSIADVLDMSCGDAVKLFENIPKIRRPLQTLCDVGLDYVTLGQSAPTLSGGEAQRVKLAAELSRPDTGRTLYLLDEPTTGLHFDDLAKLLDVLNRLVDLGNTVVVIEHNLDVIKTADWVIDLGPEAGDEGGYVVAAGTPEDIVKGRGERARGERETGRRGDEETRRRGQSAARSLTVSASPCLPLSPSPPLPSVPTPPKPWPRCWRRGRLSSANRTTSPPKPPAKRTTTTSPTSAATPECPGKSTAGAGTRSIASGGPATLAAGTAASWPRSSIASKRNPICSPRPIGASGRWSRFARRRNRTAGSSTPSPAEEWLLKMKFRIARNTFKREELVEKLDLKPLNDMPDLPLYGTEPRVRCRNLRGPWQEVELRVHGYNEIDRKEFWEFVDRAVAGFGTFAEKVQAKSDILHPWRQLGRTWHLARRGFPVGKKIHWEVNVLEELLELLARDRAEGPVPLEQQAGGADLSARPARSLGGGADEEARRGVFASDGPEGPLRHGTDHRAGLQSRVGRPPPERRRDSAEVSHAGRSGPRQLAGVLEEAFGGSGG